MNTVESRRRKQKIRNSLKAIAKRKKLNAKKQAKLDRMPSGECRLQKINLDAGFIVRLRGFDLRSLADVR
jgi:hypothetical protein